METVDRPVAEREVSRAWLLRPLTPDKHWTDFSEMSSSSVALEPPDTTAPNQFKRFVISDRETYLQDRMKV